MNIVYRRKIKNRKKKKKKKKKYKKKKKKKKKKGNLTIYEASYFMFFDY